MPPPPPQPPPLEELLLLLSLARSKTGSEFFSLIFFLIFSFYFSPLFWIGWPRVGPRHSLRLVSGDERRKIAWQVELKAIEIEQDEDKYSLAPVDQRLSLGLPGEKEPVSELAEAAPSAALLLLL